MISTIEAVLDGVVCFELKSWPWRTKIMSRASTPIASTQPQMKAIARRSGDDMLSSTIIVTTDPGLVKATARTRPAITGIRFVTSAPSSNSLRGAFDRAAAVNAARSPGHGEEAALGRSRAGLAAPGPPEDVGDPDCQNGSKQRADDVDPVVGERRSDEIGPEGAGGVHRSPRDRAAPETGECDVAA